jgi:hypothetical protein
MFGTEILKMVTAAIAAHFIRQLLLLTDLLLQFVTDYTDGLLPYFCHHLTFPCSSLNGQCVDEIFLHEVMVSKRHAPVIESCMS